MKLLQTAASLVAVSHKYKHVFCTVAERPPSGASCEIAMKNGTYQTRTRGCQLSPTFVVKIRV